MRVAMLGATFEPDGDDIGGSPALYESARAHPQGARAGGRPRQRSRTGTRPPSQPECACHRQRGAERADEVSYATALGRSAISAH